MSPKRFEFSPASYPAEAFDYHHYMKEFGATKAEAKQYVQKLKEAKTFRSDTYQVEVNPVPVPAFGFQMTWLSIKRIDREAFHDWRELQSIKNAICGPEHEAVELYPAESRLVDSANQYHLWVLPAGRAWPFGFLDRFVTSESIGGAKQREMEPDRAAQAVDA